MFRRVGLTLFFATCAFGGGMLGMVLLGRGPGQAIAQSGNTPPPPAPLPFSAAPPPAPVAETPRASAYPAPVASSPLEQLSDRFEAVYRKVGPAVVAIEAVKTSTTGSTKGKPVEESGSGVMVALDSVRGTLVLTNNHVVANSQPNQITVHLADGRLLRPSQMWTDPESDIAVLKLDNEGLPFAGLGDSDQVKVGQWVLAIGSPFGLNQSLTHGIISARERGQVSLGSTIRIKDFLQTDTPINPGSSGGPLLNLDGEIIAINTAIASQSGSNSGVAFSIPVNLVKRVVRQLVERGAVSRGYLGLQLAAVMEPNTALKLGLDRVQGALVERVYPETPAAQAGIQVNDVILRIDNTPIRNENHFINLVSTLPVGQKVRIQIWREQRSQTVDAVIGDWARAQTRFKPMQ